MSTPARPGFATDHAYEAARPAAAPRRGSEPRALREGERLIERRALDGYSVGQVLYCPRVPRGGGDGHCWTVVLAGYAPVCEDNLQFTPRDWAICRPATDAEASPRLAGRAAAVATREAAAIAARADAAAYVAAIGGLAAIHDAPPPARVGEQVAQRDGLRRADWPEGAGLVAERRGPDDTSRIAYLPRAAAVALVRRLAGEWVARCAEPGPGSVVVTAESARAWLATYRGCRGTDRYQVVAGEDPGDLLEETGRQQAAFVQGVRS